MSETIISSGPLSFRPTEPGDLDFVLSAEQAEDNRRFVFQQSREQHLQYMADTSMLHLIIEKKATPVGYLIIAGVGGLNRSIELKRIVVTRKGEGLGRAAIKLCQKLAFESLGAHRLWLDVVQYNQRAIHIYLSEGFVQEGVLRECDLFEGRFASLVIMSMLEPEYRQKYGGDVL